MPATKWTKSNRFGETEMMCCIFKHNYFSFLNHGYIGFDYKESLSIDYSTFIWVFLIVPQKN